MEHRSRIPLAQTLLIVPDAHYRIFDTAFQTEMYELFHRHWISRVLHMVCTPVIVAGMFLALRLIPVGHSPLDLATFAAMLLVAYHLGVNRLAGLATAPFVGGALIAAHALPANLVLALGMIVIGGVVQAMSHAAEPMPPPWSGTYGFVPMGQWMRHTPLWKIVLVFVASTVFVGLEIWAAPRVWVLQALHLMMQGGYRPDLRHSLDERLTAILNGSRQGWRGQLGLDAPAH